MKAYLIYVDAEKMNSNKFYNMELVGSTINVEYGRVGSSSTKLTDPFDDNGDIINDSLGG